MSRPLLPFRPSPLQWALFGSLAFHALLLTVRFVDPEAFNRVFEDTPLEVVLVNARSSTPPEKAQAIAQVNLAGGGNVEKGRATSPLPPAELTNLGDSAEAAQRRLRALQREQSELLTQIKRSLAALPPPEQERQPGEQQPETVEERRQQLLKMLAEIEKRIYEENARPKRRYISPSTREAVYAMYYDRLRQRIETRGTQSFPEYQGQKLYGELTMVLTVDAQGRLLETEVAQRSASPQLDRRAEAIVRAAAPFGAFPAEMRAQADQVVVVSRFRFTRDAHMQTQLLGSE